MALGVGVAGAVFTTMLPGGHVAGAGDALFPALRASLLAASLVAALGAAVGRML